MQSWFEGALLSIAHGNRSVSSFSSRVVWSEAVSLSLDFIAYVVLLLGSVFVVVRSLLCVILSFIFRY